MRPETNIFLSFYFFLNPVFLLNSSWSFLSVVQGYHELYELQRSRLEAQLLQMTEQRDKWKDLTLGLALKVCSPTL